MDGFKATSSGSSSHLPLPGEGRRTDCHVGLLAMISPIHVLILHSDILACCKKPSSVSRLRGTREPPSPMGKAFGNGLPRRSACNDISYPRPHFAFCILHFTLYYIVSSGSQKSRVKAEKTKIFFQKASSGFGDVSFKERSGRFKA